MGPGERVGRIEAGVGAKDGRPAGMPEKKGRDVVDLAVDRYPPSVFGIVVVEQVGDRDSASERSIRPRAA
jgi:hypothetical protein